MSGAVRRIIQKIEEYFKKIVENTRFLVYNLTINDKGEAFGSSIVYVRDLLGAALAAPTLFSHPLLLRRQPGGSPVAFAELQGGRLSARKFARASDPFTESHVLACVM
jgi:hypothetical protein